MNPDVMTESWEGYRLRHIYEYGDLIKSLLYQFKGCYDIALAPLFLGDQASVLKLLYHDFVIVPAPSFPEADEKRGFNHVVEIFKILDLPILRILRKTEDVKQADLTAEERKEVGKHLAIENGESIQGKKVLLVDDVLTTGSTMRACIALLLPYGPKKVEILVMSKVKGHDLQTV